MNRQRTAPRSATAVIGVGALLVALTACTDPAPPPAATTTAASTSVSAPAAAASAQEPAPTPRPADERRRRPEDRQADRLRAAEAAGVVEIAEAQRRHLHGATVELDGLVKKLLSEDRRGLQHQRFLVTVEGAGTVLIAHNIDLAGHVPVAVGGAVRVRGIFEWNPKGGVVHWTHHDPRGRFAGGWIRYDGKTYR